MLSMSVENSIKKLNALDYIPAISTIFSGPLRIIAGTVQVVAGSVLLGLSITFGWLQGTEKWYNDVSINFTEVCHGIGNISRGTIALCPILGNVILYIYDEENAEDQINKTEDESSPPAPRGRAPIVLRPDEDGYYSIPAELLGMGSGTISVDSTSTIGVGDRAINIGRGLLPEGCVLGT